MISKFFASALLLSCSLAHSAVITFDKLAIATSTFTFTGGTSFGTNSPTPQSGYQAMKTFTNSKYFIYNDFEAIESGLTLNGSESSTFTLNSFAIVGAWGTQTLTIQGKNNGFEIYTKQLSINLNPKIEYFNWQNIDEIIILTGDDFIYNPASGNGFGQHWVLDNLTMNESIPSVPLPATAWLFGSGLIALAGAARRRN
jgi:hypothetical protein